MGHVQVRKRWKRLTNGILKLDFSPDCLQNFIDGLAAKQFVYIRCVLMYFLVIFLFDTFSKLIFFLKSRNLAWFFLYNSSHFRGSLLCPNKCSVVNDVSNMAQLGSDAGEFLLKLKCV